MTEHSTPQRTEGPGYETRDVNIRAVAWLALGVAGVAALVLVALWLLVSDWGRQAERSDPAPSPLAAETPQWPEPRLQPAPLHDYQDLRAEQDRVLSSYGWIDKQQGKVRIPIERAMELLVVREGPGSEARGQDEVQGTGDRRPGKKVRSEQTGVGDDGYSVLSTQYSVPRAESGMDQSRINSLVQQVGLDQRLGEQAPLELTFRDEQDQPVTLGELAKDRPLILSLVYYRCPMLCTQVLNGLLKSSNSMTLQLGDDYEIISVSIDPRETATEAARKKDRYVAAYRRSGAEQGWHFLTGEQDQIERLAAAVGFRYQYDPRSNQYAHPSGIVVLTPDGRISRYFYGIDYPPRDLRLGLVESSEGRIGSAVDQILLLCFHYDPATGKYGLVISRVIQIAGTATALLLGSYLWAMFRLERRRTAAARLAEQGSVAADTST